MLWVECSSKSQTTPLGLPDGWSWNSGRGERVVSLILERAPFGPDVEVSIEGGLNRPPFERTSAVRAPYETARRLAAELGFDLPETSRGGVSDGNFTAALGIAALDGLGCCGDGAHAEDEHILLSSIPQRLGLMIMIMLMPMLA